MLSPAAMDFAYDLLVLSDIHLSDGRAPPPGGSHLVPELVKFLAAHEQHPVAGRHHRLIANGDLFDFLHVQLRHGEVLPFALSRTEQERGPGTTEEKSVWKLERILGANQPFLLALGRFLAAGNEVIILPGNHDLELYWPRVRARILEQVAALAGANAASRLTFRPWFYHEPAVLYVEHGAQFDSDNRVFRWLAPEVPDEPGVLELPAGGIVNRYFTHRLGLGPFVGDTSQSALGYALWMVRQFGILKYFVLFVWYLSFCWRVTTWAGRKSPASAVQQTLHETRRADLEGAERMPPGALAAIEAAAPPPAMHSKWQMLDRSMLPRVVVGGTSLAGAILILALGGLSTSTLLVAAAIFLLPMALLTLTRGTYIGVADRYYPAAAAAARRALGVAHVAFGHQHIARPEREADGDERYFNLGCWIEGEGFEKVPLHYLELRLSGERPHAELKRWPATAEAHPRSADLPSIAAAQPST